VNFMRRSMAESPEQICSRYVATDFKVALNTGDNIAQKPFNYRA
jgi:hypothetical protein